MPQRIFGDGLNFSVKSQKNIVALNRFTTFDFSVDDSLHIALEDAGPRLSLQHFVQRQFQLSLPLHIGFVKIEVFQIRQLVEVGGRTHIT